MILCAEFAGECFQSINQFWRHDPCLDLCHVLIVFQSVDVCNGPAEPPTIISFHDVDRTGSGNRLFFSGEMTSKYPLTFKWTIRNLSWKVYKYEVPETGE